MGTFVCHSGNQILRRCEADLKCLYIHTNIWYGTVYVLHLMSCVLFGVMPWKSENWLISHWQIFYSKRFKKQLNRHLICTPVSLADKVESGNICQKMSWKKKIRSKQKVDL